DLSGWADGSGRTGSARADTAGEIATLRCGWHARPIRRKGWRMGIETVFIFGAGYSARAFAQADRGGARRIFGTTRDAAKFGILERSGMRPVLFDGCSLSHDARAALQETTHLIVSIAPGKTGDPVLEILDGNL